MIVHTFFLPIFTAAIDEKYFSKDLKILILKFTKPPEEIVNTSVFVSFACFPKEEPSLKVFFSRHVST